MNRTELAAKVAEQANLTKKDADRIVGMTMDAIMDAVAQGDKVQIVGFGTFEVRERSERMGRDPRTNAEIKIPATKTPSFRPGKVFKEKIR